VVWCDVIFRGASARGQLLTAAETGEEAFTNSGRSMREEHAGGACGRSMREEHAGGACGRSMREEHAGGACRRSMREEHAGGACGRSMREEHAGGACGRSMREEHAAGACGRSMRQEHAGERSGSLPRTDAVQIRGNLAPVVQGGVSERRLSTTRTRELKRLKYNKTCAPIFKRTCRGGSYLLSFAFTSAFGGGEDLLPFGYEWYCVVLYFGFGLRLQYLLYFVLYA
jgi:hypothetical protein